MYYRSFEFNWFKEPYGELIWQNQLEIEIPSYVAAGKKICLLIFFETKQKSNLTPKAFYFKIVGRHSRKSGLFLLILI